MDENKIFKALPCSPPPLAYPDAKLIERAANLLIRAKKPLVIVGKGKREDFVENFFTRAFFFPFLCWFSFIHRCSLRSSWRSSERVYLFDERTLFANTYGKRRCTGHRWTLCFQRANICLAAFWCDFIVRREIKLDVAFWTTT